MRGPALSSWPLNKSEKRALREWVRGPFRKEKRYRRLFRQLRDLDRRGKLKTSHFYTAWLHAVKGYSLKEASDITKRGKRRAREASKGWWEKAGGDIIDFAEDAAKVVTDAAGVVSDALPYIETALSLVPGVGTGIAAALSAAESLAKGRPITDALINAAQDAMPGGPAARMAFRTAVHMAKGKDIDEAVFNAAKAELPEAAQRAFDAGVAMAEGKKLQKVAVDAVLKSAPEQIKQLAAGAGVPKDAPVPERQRKGYKLGRGVLKSASVTPVQAIAIRKRLKPHTRAGYDLAMQHAAQTQKGRPARAYKHDRPLVELNVFV